MTDEMIFEKQKMVSEIEVYQREYENLCEQEKTIQDKKKETDAEIMKRVRKISGLEKKGIKGYIVKFRNL